MADLRIADDLALPPDTATDTIGILAVKGAGKTYTFLVLAEEMIRAGIPVVVIDVVGVCWGLRASADGEGTGLPVVIFGGSHGDLPLASTSGAALADVVASERLACVLDLSAFETKSETIRFVLDFITRLYRVNREPLHVILDEADDVAPQKPFGEETRMLRAVEVMVRRGRARGLGVTLATQRAAVLNKNVLTQIGTLVVGRTTAPQDRKAIEAWVEAHGTADQRDELLASLASLPTGTVWVWSPLRNVFQKVQIRPRETFDSSATPKVGATIITPSVLADVDLEAIRARLDIAAEPPEHPTPTRDQKRALAEMRTLLDEREAHIRSLETELRELRARPSTALTQDDWGRLERLAEAYGSASAEAGGLGDILFRALHGLNIVPPPGSRVRGVTTPTARAPRAAHPSSGNTANLPTPQQRIVDALAAFDALGIYDVSRANLAVFAGASPKSSAYGANLSRLSETGLIAYPLPGTVAITNAGRALAAQALVPPTLAALHDAWRSKLTPAAWRVLAVLIECHPESMTRVALAGRAEVSPTSSAYGATLSVIRELGLIHYPSAGRVSATSLLFPEGLR